MFLGGPLDHAIRHVAADEIRRDRPAADEYFQHGYSEGSKRLDQTARYELRRCESGPWVWYVYVLAGHEPPASHLIDANPGPFYRH